MYRHYQAIWIPDMKLSIGEEEEEVAAEKE